MAEEKPKKSLRAILLSLGLIVLLLIGLIKFGNLLAFLSIFSWLTGTLVESAGMNIWLARLIAFVPTILLLLGISLSFSFMPSLQRNFPFLKFKRTERRWGYILLSGLFFGYCGFMFLIDDLQRFDPKTGEAKKCIALGPSDYEEITCEWDFHPDTGNKVIKDQAQIKAIYTARSSSPNDPGNIKKIVNNGRLRFFDSAGNPLVWYYEYSDGRIELYDSPGQHPQFNTTLNPINPAIVEKLLGYKKSNTAEGKVSIDSQAESGNPLINLRDYLFNLHE